MSPVLRDGLAALLMTATVGGFVFWQKANAPAPASGVAASTSGDGLTLESVSTHNTRESCWAVINGGVYDLTSWIPQHPGGEAAILQLCGTDGSAKFNGKHGGAATQAAILAGFKVGELDGTAATTTVSSPAFTVPVDDHGRGRGRGGDD